MTVLPTEVLAKLAAYDAQMAGRLDDVEKRLEAARVAPARVLRLLAYVRVALLVVLVALVMVALVSDSGPLVPALAAAAGGGALVFAVRFWRRRRSTHAGRRGEPVSRARR